MFDVKTEENTKMNFAFFDIPINEGKGGDEGGAAWWWFFKPNETLTSPSKPVATHPPCFLVLVMIMTACDLVMMA